MRELIIKRGRAFAGCVVKLKACVTDEQGELSFGGHTWHVLGTLKNGEEKTFSITEEPVMVTVMNDVNFARYCGVKELPAGADPVRLSGRIVLNAPNGNPFRFDD